jgi:hypothetical protein
MCVRVHIFSVSDAKANVGHHTDKKEAAMESIKIVGQTVLQNRSWTKFCTL